MTALKTSAFPAPSANPLASFAAAAVHLGREMADAWRHRRDVALLASFDDRMLADIGLTRADINDALAVPPWRDPTTVLIRRRGERRMSRSKVVDLLRRCAAPPTVPDTVRQSARGTRVRITP